MALFPGAFGGEIRAVAERLGLWMGSSRIEDRSRLLKGECVNAGVWACVERPVYITNAWTSVNGQTLVPGALRCSQRSTESILILLLFPRCE